MSATLATKSEREDPSVSCILANEFGDLVLVGGLAVSEDEDVSGSSVVMREEEHRL